MGGVDIRRHLHHSKNRNNRMKYFTTPTQSDFAHLNNEELASIARSAAAWNGALLGGKMVSFGNFKMECRRRGVRIWEEQTEYTSEATLEEIEALF